MAVITSDRARTAERTESLGAYFKDAVFHGTVFTCPNASGCLASRGSQGLITGQLHHVGGDYDLTIDGRPIRIAVIGQEYGGGGPFTTLEKRSGDVAASGELRFKAGGGIKARNPHMRGTTSVLRLLLGLGLGTDCDGEHLTLADGRRPHVFDCFALTNFLLCSAVNSGTKTRGLSTPVMRENCRAHFRRAMDILEPTVLVLQSKWFLSDVLASFDRHEMSGASAYRVHRGGAVATLLAFTHPASHGKASNWGWNAHTPYLLGTVQPAVERWQASHLTTPTLASPS